MLHYCYFSVVRERLCSGHLAGVLKGHQAKSGTAANLSLSEHFVVLQEPRLDL